MPAYHVQLDHSEIQNVSKESLSEYLSDIKYTPTIRFLIDANYIDPKVVWVSLKRYFQDFREYLQFDETFGLISFKVPYETIDGLDLLWNQWLTYLAEHKLNEIRKAA